MEQEPQTNFFQNISIELRKVKTASQVKKRTREAAEWFTNKVTKTDPKRINLAVVLKGRRAAQKLAIGQMYAFRYQSKLFNENKLDFYDRAPLIIFIGDDEHGNMLGLNLHYIPPVARAKILSALTKTIKAKKLRHDTRMNIDYGAVKSISTYKPLRYAIKAYIPNRIESKLVRIQPNEWHHSIFLPFDNWVATTARKVWRNNPYL